MRLCVIISLAFLLITTLCACPYNSAYQLDDEPQQNIDESLLGKWATMVTRVINDKVQKEEPVKIIFSKRTDMEYDIAITGYIDELKLCNIVTEDTIKCTGFLSTVADKQFLNVILYKRIYLAEVSREDDKLSILPMSDHFTNKLIKSNESLRVALNFHLKTMLDPVYDEEFLLKNLQRVN